MWYMGQGVHLLSESMVDLKLNALPDNSFRVYVESWLNHGSLDTTVLILYQMLPITASSCIKNIYIYMTEQTPQQDANLIPGNGETLFKDAD